MLSLPSSYTTPMQYYFGFCVYSQRSFKQSNTRYIFFCLIFLSALLRYNLQRAKLLPFSFSNTLYFLTPQKKGSLLLGILKWRKSLSGFRNRKAAHWPASNLPGHSPGFVPTCKHNKSGSMLDKKGNESWNSWALGGLANPPESKKSYDSQSETNNIVKVKPELHFCT